MSTPTDRTDYANAATEWTYARKKAYPDEKFAKRVAAQVNEREGRVAVVHYACTRCGRYHIGRAPA